MTYKEVQKFCGHQIPSKTQYFYELSVSELKPYGNRFSLNEVHMVKIQKKKVLGKIYVNVASQFLKLMFSFTGTEKIRTNIKDCCCCYQV